MQRWRSILGLVAGAFMIVSSAAHSLLGWKAMSGALEKVPAPDELIRALGAGWHFGGAAMLAFGCIVVTVFAQRIKGLDVSLVPTIVIGVTYVAFGAGALLVGPFDPFFLVFVVPGSLLLIASLSRRER